MPESIIYIYGANTEEREGAVLEFFCVGKV